MGINENEVPNKRVSKSPIPRTNNQKENTVPGYMFVFSISLENQMKRLVCNGESEVIPVPPFTLTLVFNQYPTIKKLFSVIGTMLEDEKYLLQNEETRRVITAKIYQSAIEENISLFNIPIFDSKSKDCIQRFKNRITVYWHENSNFEGVIRLNKLLGSLSIKLIPVF